MFQTKVASNTSSSSSVELRVPDFFPKTSKTCLPVSEKFFQCFTEASFITPANNKDIDVGINGLKKCVEELKAYEKCMINDKKWKRSQSYRVQEAYRVNSSEDAKLNGT